ncbi:acid phosphatase [Achromobacter xylosoxidans]
MSSLSPPAATRPTPAAYLATHVLGVTLFLACLAWWANASGWDLAIARALFNPALDDFPLHTNRWLELIGHRMVLALPIGIGLGAIAVAAASYRIPAWRSLRGPALALALTCMAGQLAITQLKHYTTLPRPTTWTRWAATPLSAVVVDLGSWQGRRRAAQRPCRRRLFAAGPVFRRLGRRAAGLALVGLAAGIAAGLAFSAVRILQGAHFLSQTLWSAALMWLLAALFFGRCCTGRAVAPPPYRLLN